MTDTCLEPISAVSLCSLTVVPGSDRCAIHWVPTATCPRCKRVVALDVDGKMKSHGTITLGGRSAYKACSGKPKRNVERCGSGWTNDRCTKRLGHRGPHSND